MAAKNAFTPKASLTDAPTNLKEAIDWVLRVTGRDGNNNNGECICGLAAAVTDLLQSVELEYHGYQGESDGSDPKKGPPKEKVTDRLNELFSLVQGLGGTAVVRTYIDQLAQVLSALVGWSRIVQCDKGGWKGTCTKGDKQHHGQKTECEYLKDVEPNKPCEQCMCMKWKVKDPNNEGTPLGRKCTRCSDSGGTAKCTCDTSGGACTAESCKCALAGKCCKCCCNGRCGKCSDKCSCVEKEEKQNDTNNRCRRIYNDSYQSAYSSHPYGEYFEKYGMTTTWKSLLVKGMAIYGMDNPGTASQRRHHCARILLGSVCLIWSGLTYMYWTGKWANGSPYWNNHILDGTGLDDGTLSQWLQALGFPREMLNNSGPGNRLDAVIWDGFRDMLFLGFLEPSGLNNHHVNDTNGNTARAPFGMNYAGFVHTAHRDSFNTDQADVFKDNGTAQGINQHKNGAIFKLYILSCAYFTGLQKKTSESTAPKNPKTIREILYWLSALPYSKAYKYMLEYAKEVLKKKAPDVDGKKQLSFYQTGRWAPITVDEYNLFAHFQAVTQYCPLVLIGIQGGLKGTDSTTPAIHALYANTECSFTYPTVPIQAYNQVVHYIRALFYQLYFLRKQCAVKVTCGGKWRECRYGKDVVSKGVISWMCLGCDPMEHDRKSRVEKVKGELDGVPKGTSGEIIEKLKELLKAIGDVVVQLGNAQERLDRGKSDLDGVMKALNEVFSGVNGSGNNFKKVLQEVLGEVEKKVDKLKGDSGLKEAATKAKEALQKGKEAIDNQNGTDVDPCKNLVSAAIDGIHKALGAFKQWAEQDETVIIEQAKSALEHLGNITGVGNEVNLRNVKLEAHYSAMLKSIKDLISICNSAKCPTCDNHYTKCGKPPVPRQCPTCHQQYMDGKPSPLQAFLEDRLPGFSCQEVVNDDKENPVYPPAASHLGHCGGSGQCCPLPMGFRGHFQGGSTSDMTGSRLYAILYFFSNENLMQSCVYRHVRVTAELSATTPQVLGDVFGFFRGGVGEKESGKNKKGNDGIKCQHEGDPSNKGEDKYFCGWCASGLRDEVKKIEPYVLDNTSFTTATAVIKALIDQLALGLQKWVGWQEGDECCLKGEKGESTGIGKKCECSGAGGSAGCCNGGTKCHECGTCGTSASGAGQKCYQSAYCKATGQPSGDYYWPTISSDSTKVHLLARIFLGSVCLIWSGLTQLGFLTGGSSDRWSQEGTLHEEQHGLGSFMAAMGYDLDRLNQDPGE